jgi:hypothetical protein
MVYVLWFVLVSEVLDSELSWFVVYGLWFVMVSEVLDSELSWFMVYGLWFMVYGSWFMVYGLSWCLKFWIQSCLGVLTGASVYQT